MRTRTATTATRRRPRSRPARPTAAASTPGTQTILDPDNFGQPAHEINNEPIFQAELRSSFHRDTVLARYYAASISRLQYGSNGNPQADSPLSALVYGGGGGDGTPAFNGYDPYGKPYTLVIPGPNNPSLSGANPANGGNLGGFNAYYDSAEEDRLAGTSFEYDHFLGGGSGDVVSFAYDRNHARTHSYSFLFPTDSVPAGSTQDTTTLLLRGIFTFGKLNLTASNYLTNFRSHYGVYDTSSSLPAPLLSFQDQSLWHYDGRLGLVLRPSADTSLRFALGSAVAPPYLGALVANTYAPTLCGGFFTPCLPGGGLVAYSQTANPNLAAETSFGYDLGADRRLRDGTVLTADLYLTNLRNQLVRSTFANGTATVDDNGIAAHAAALHHRLRQRLQRSLRGAGAGRAARPRPRPGIHPARGAAARVPLQPRAVVLRQRRRPVPDQSGRRAEPRTSARTRPSRTRPSRTRKPTASCATASPTPRC